MPDSMEIDGSTLKLNGLGLRKKFFFSVYVGGLYLPETTDDARLILEGDTAKMVRLQFMRDVSKPQLADSIEDGFKSNSSDKTKGQKDNIKKLATLMSEVKTGELLTINYTPGKGTNIKKGDSLLAHFDSKEFADAVFSIWLGSSPPSKDLKNGMLGL